MAQAVLRVVGTQSRDEVSIGTVGSINPVDSRASVWWSGSVDLVDVLLFSFVCRCRRRLHIHASDAMRHLTFDSALLNHTIREWRVAHPGLGLLALVPEAEKDGVPMLQAICREQGVPLAGAVFPALVATDGFSCQGLWLLPLASGTPVVLIPGIGADASDAAARIAAAVEQGLSAPVLAGGKPTLYMFFDGLIGNIASILDELYLRVADRVDYAGVNAGSETFQPMPCLFDGDRVIGGGALAVLLADMERTVLAHGYPVPERVMTATSTEGNRVQSIDWRPAFEVYREIIGEEYGIALTRENFYEYAVHFPFGILRAEDDVVVRIPVALADDGSLLCIGEVPEQAMLALLRAPTSDTEGCIERIAESLAEKRDAGQGRDLLAFYCAGRRMHLGDAARSELSTLQARTGALVMGGALSLGEIGSTSAWGYPMFHNAALVCTLWRHA